MQSFLTLHSEVNSKLKIVFLGDRGVGKSSIIRRFISNKFQYSSNSTVGVDFLSKKLQFENKTIKLQLWDTAGQQQFRSLVKNYIRDANVCVLVYDCTNSITYKNLLIWIEIVQAISIQNCYRIIVGNKSDIVTNSQDIKQMFQKDKRQIKKNYKNIRLLDQIKVSAKDGNNIYNLFQNIVYKGMRKLQANNLENFNRQKLDNLKLQDSKKYILNKQKLEKYKCC